MSSVFHSEGGRPRALITGLRGFTGRYLATELEAAGYEVFGTVTENESAGAVAYPADLSNREQLTKAIQIIRPDVVAHLAGISFVSHGDAEDIYRTNVVGTRNLLDALDRLAHRPRAILLASSANVYGNATGAALDEDTPTIPVNDYGISKLAMEHVAGMWRGRLPIVIARPFNYTGVGQHANFLLPKIVSHFVRGQRRIELGNLDIARDFSDVRDVVVFYRQLLDAAPEWATVNICSGQVCSLAAVIAMMEEIADYKIEVVTNPAFVRANEIKCLAGSPERLYKMVGRRQRIALADTLRWMYAEDKSRLATPQQPDRGGL